MAAKKSFIVLKALCILEYQTLAKKPRDAVIEAEGQEEEARAKSQRSENQRDPKSKSRGSQLAKSEPELKDK